MLKKLETVHGSVFGTIDLKFVDENIFKRTFSKESYFDSYKKSFFCNGDLPFDLRAVGEVLSLKDDLECFLGKK